MKKIIVISAVNLSEGGPLTIIKSVLDFLNTSNFLKTYKVVALVHSKLLFEGMDNVELIEFPEIKSSWLKRLKFEYLDCMKISKKLNSFLWLSLHDISPNVVSDKRAVYCHNPSPFYKQSNIFFFKNPIRYLYARFYKKLYQLNIHKNDYVIVQQKWIKDEFVKMFNLTKEKIIVALPEQDVDKYPNVLNFGKQNEGKKIFFYPAFPREFKNFEIICKAVQIVKQQTNTEFEVVLTIDGSENEYSQTILEKYGNTSEINFIGLQSKSQVENFYLISDCLLFPSKLETWGLPLSEYKRYNKPMLVADLPYAYETVGNYEKVKYFDPNSERDLSEAMIQFLNEKIEYKSRGAIFYDQPYCENWNELFKHLLK